MKVTHQGSPTAGAIIEVSSPAIRLEERIRILRERSLEFRYPTAVEKFREEIEGLENILTELQDGETPVLEQRFFEIFKAYATKNPRLAFACTESLGITEKEQLQQIFEVANGRIMRECKKKGVRTFDYLKTLSSHNAMNRVITEWLRKRGDEAFVTRYAPSLVESA